MISRFLVNNKDYHDWKSVLLENVFLSPNSDDFKRGMWYAFTCIETLGTPDQPEPEVRVPDTDLYPQKP